MLPVTDKTTVPGGAPSGQVQQYSVPKQPEKKHSSRPGLYLKVESKDSPLYKKALQYTAIFDGATPLYLYFTQSKKLVLAPAELRVDVNEPLLRALRDLLGDENVALVE